MAIRRIVEDPLSQTATWARRFALFAIPVMLLVIVITRAGFIEMKPALATIGGALGLAAIGVLLAFVSFIGIWNHGYSGFGRAMAAIAIGAGLFAYPTYLGVKWYKSPQLTDITTDPIDPPRFEVAARFRPRDANPVIYPGLRAAELQREAYPDVEPLIVSATPQQAYDAALDVMTKRKWLVIDARRPQPRREGRIEAVVRSPVMGFRDDIVVRIRTETDGARVDIRSASRYGSGDFGDNAARIRSLAEDIDEVSTAIAEKPAPKPTKAAQRPGSKR